MRRTAARIAWTAAAPGRRAGWSGRTRRAAAALALAVLLLPAPTRAVGWFDPAGYWLPVGLSTGLSVGGGRGLGAVVGGEVSFARVTEEVFWYGLYTDVLYDTNAETVRWGIGPEVGWAFFGLDAGVVNEWHVGDPDHQTGGQARLCLTIGAFSLYARWDFLFEPGPVTHIGEFGILLKFPFRLPVGS